MNLLEFLTEEDKEKISNYVKYYGGGNGAFIGVDEWLKDWAKDNKKLFKLLGNKFIVEIPYTYKKSSEMIESEIKELLESELVDNIKSEFHNVIFALEEEREIDYDTRLNLFNLWNSLCFYRNSTFNTIKIKINNRSLQIQKGAKPIKALGKAIKWLKEIKNNQKICEDFEKFRQKHSMIYNDADIKSTLVLSIHPMDFLTMSDNNNNWSSCMSWLKSGCYHAGTVEMMNSNVALCAYLKSKCDFKYAINYDEEKDEFSYDNWNSKQWRQLIYVNKDIILAGKPYPFQSEDMTKVIITEVKKLAKNNFNWDYHFGPELYFDMLGVNSLYGMERVRQMYFDKKKNIFVHTNAMYNDMLNDNSTEYWCYRNKPKKSYILNLSGKISCVCCGNYNVIGESDYYTDEYNDRFDNTGKTICYDCEKENNCHYCDRSSDSIIGIRKLYNLLDVQGESIKVCKDHLEEEFCLCPCCGEMIKNPYAWESYYYCSSNMIFDKEKIQKDWNIDLYYWRRYDFVEKLKTLDRVLDKGLYFPIYLCGKCINTLGMEITLKRINPDNWYSEKRKIIKQSILTFNFSKEELIKMISVGSNNEKFNFAKYKENETIMVNNSIYHTY